MNNTVLFHRNSIYKDNNFIKVGKFKGNNLFMGIDKLSFISYIDNQFERNNTYHKLDFLSREKSKEYKIEKIKDKHYKRCIKITSINNPDFYLVISYIFSHKQDNGGIRIELSPQYDNTQISSIYNIVEWLKDSIGDDTVKNLLKNSKITRIDIAVDIYSNQFISNYYFSIPKSRTGVRFNNNKDSCKNNYAIGNNRSELYLLVYEKAKLIKESNIGSKELISVKEKDIVNRITRLELRIKPKKELLLSSISELKNPFSKINIYSKRAIQSRFCDFLPFLEKERSLPIAINSFLDCVGSSSRYMRYQVNKTLENCKSKHILDIDWQKWQDIVRILSPINTLS
ncbi:MULTISPECIES: hypothetical protein [unclassified Mannheimia]|uniref:hypothetical protein n=1 Tax=unclassified Mannheimia TaxID=2645054 RepID=UPI00359E8F1D